MNSDVLAQWIDRKRALLEKLREVVQRQAGWVQQGDMEKLLSVLAVKQQMLVELQGIEKQLDPFRAEEPERRVWRSDAQRQHTRQAAEQSTQLLREIMELDQACEGELQRRRDATARQLQGMHTASHARSAYLHGAAESNCSLDLSSET